MCLVQRCQKFSLSDNCQVIGLKSVKLDRKFKNVYYIHKTETHWNLGMAYEI